MGTTPPIAAASARFTRSRTPQPAVPSTSSRHSDAGGAVWSAEAIGGSGGGTSVILPRLGGDRTGSGLPDGPGGGECHHGPPRRRPPLGRERGGVDAAR